MTDRAERFPNLPAVLEHHLAEISAALAKMVHQLPNSHYRERPLAELERSAQRGLQALIQGLTSGSYTSLEHYLNDLALARLRMEFDIDEIIEALLLVKEATLPVILKAFAPGSPEAHEAVVQLDAGLRYAISRFGYLYTKAMQRQLQQQQQRTSLMLQAAQTTSSSLKLDQVLQQTAEGMATAVGVSHCGIYLMDEEQGVLVLQTGMGDLTGDHLETLRNRSLDPAADSFVREVLEHRKPVVCADAGADPRVDREIVQLLGLKSVLAVPIETGDQLLGVIMLVTFDDYHAFIPAEIELAWGIANSVALAIENARLYEETQQRLAESLSLQRVTAALLQKLNLEEVLEIVCTEAQSMTGATESAVCLLQDDMCLRTVFDIATPSSPTFECRPVEGSLVEAIARKDSPLLTNDPAREAWTYRRDAALTALLAVPLRVKGDLIGALDVVNKPGGFTGEDLRILSLFADQAAIAIENARLHQQVEQLAVVQERQRLARELHDSLTHALYSVILYAEAATRLLMAENQRAAIEHLHELRDTAQEALREMRLLIFDLRSPALEEGLVAALQAQLEAVATQAGVQTDLRVAGKRRLSPVIEEELYRIAQEALNNVVKHARAQRVTVNLQVSDKTVYLEIGDDGAGFEPATAYEQGGLGLRGMEERLKHIGGNLEVDSAVGQGTRVRVRVSLAEPRPQWPKSCVLPRPLGRPSQEVASVAQTPIRVLIADDQAIVRKGIRALLATEPDMQVVGEASSGQEAVTQAEALQPDVILMDLVMPGLDGIKATEQIVARHPELRILVLTSFATDDKVFPVIKAGVSGYLLKDSSPEELVQAIRQVYRGESSLHPSIARKVLQGFARGSKHPSSPHSLTEREVEVLGLLVQGQSNRQIADELVISETTVRTHVSNLLSKLQLTSRTEAVLYALREGLVSLEAKSEDEAAGKE